jgi:hypothetical protein
MSLITFNPFCSPDVDCFVFVGVEQVGQIDVADRAEQRHCQVFVYKINVGGVKAGIYGCRV